MKFRKGERLDERFRRNYTEDASGCWLWTAAKASNGYGAFWNRTGYVSAHRFSWALRHGNPGKMFVLHKCDVRACVNPAHLFLGTQTDNMRDKTAKGRQSRGATHRVGHGKSITAEQVAYMQAQRNAGVRGTVIAKELGIHRMTVYKHTVSA